MRLFCPNCHAEYDVPEGMVPAAGRHVQCTACHTRWFVRGSAEAAPSEDQILSRLETRPRVVPANPGARTAELAGVRREPEVRETVGPAAPTRPAAVVPTRSAQPAPVVHLRPRLEPAKPSAPAPVPASAPVPPPAARPAPHTAGLPPPVRAPLRLELDPPAAAPPAPVPVEQSSGGFGLGMALVLLLFLLGLVAYDQRRELAAEFPAAASALDGYGDAIDGLRLDAERTIAPLRARLDAALDGDA
jgi:predicted Zn finger-like uncharacterized protein